MKKIAFALLLTALSTAVFAQQLRDNTWKTLSKVTFKKQTDELLGLKIDVPVFGKEVRALEGKEITLRGYIIPTDGYKNQKHFVFSAFPYNMCFFCGMAGPETVIEVGCKDPIIYVPDAVTIRGTLQLNSSDNNQFIYSLRNVVKLQ